MLAQPGIDIDASYFFSECRGSCRDVGKDAGSEMTVH